MQSTQLHLIVAQAIPLTLIAGLALLLVGAVKGSQRLRAFAYIVLVVAGLMGWAVYITGGFASPHPGSVLSGDLGALARHHAAATYAVALVAITGLGSLVALFADRAGSGFQILYAIGLLAVGLLSLSMVCSVVYLGGSISH
jgi:hypothetical protein